MHQTFSNHAVAAVTSTALSWLCVCSAHAVALTPTAQNREVRAFTIVPPCPPGTVSDFDEIFSFGPFDSSVNGSHSCAAAGGGAVASQQSDITPAGLSATGSTHSDATTVSFTTIHAISNSIYDVTFTLDDSARYTMSGSISAQGAAPVRVCTGRAILQTGGGAAIHSHTVQMSFDGAAHTAKFDHVGVLAAGTYRLVAAADTMIDATIPPIGGGDASYDITFDIFDVADINLDGVVDGLDLGLLLAMWSIPPGSPGCSGLAIPEPCPADLNDDGVVDGVDLGILLAAWTM